MFLCHIDVCLYPSPPSSLWKISKHALGWGLFLKKKPWWIIRILKIIIKIHPRNAIGRPNEKFRDFFLCINKYLVVTEPALHQPGTWHGWALVTSLTALPAGYFAVSRDSHLYSALTFRVFTVELIQQPLFFHFHSLLYLHFKCHLHPTGTPLPANTSARWGTIMNMWRAGQ